MTAPPPPSLLDQQVRLALAAAAEALAAAPGALYPVVYVGPLRTPDLLRGAVSDAAQAFGVPASEWGAGAPAPDPPSLLLCRWTEAADAIAAIAGSSGVQMVAWGDVAADALPAEVRELFSHQGALLLDPRDHCVPGSGGAWLGGPVERAAAGPAGPANPLVVVAPADAQRTHVDLALMHLEAAGAEPVEVVSGRDAHAPRRGDGVVARWTDGAHAAELAALAASCRAAGCPLVIVAPPAGWDRLRAAAAWTATVGACAVVRAGELPPDAALAGLPWPRVTSLWVGAPAAAAEVEPAALMLPEGTTLVEALGHLEVRARPGRLVAWRSDRLALVEIDQRPAGAVVVGVRIDGDAPAADREAALARLDEIRGWPGVRLALLPAADRTGPPAGVEETVQRIGFFFARLDDERGGAPAPARTGPAQALHAVATALLGLGLPDAARGLLRRAERESRLGVDEEVLLGYLVAENDPEEAVTRLRDAALRLAAVEEDTGDAWALQTDATLNALLLMVRARHVAAADAWGSVEGWLRQAGTLWVASPRHAAVLFELAARAGRPEEARRFGDLFRSMAGPGEPLAAALAPALQAVGSGSR